MHDHNIYSLATINWSTSPRRNSLPLSSHQYPEKTQRLFRLQNCLSLKSSISRKYPKTFSPAELSWPQIIKIPEISKDFPASKQYSSSNRQPSSTINNSNQQQQPATAINSSNQQQQPTAATSSSNQQQQSATATSFHPSTSTHAATSKRPRDFCTTNASLR